MNINEFIPKFPSLPNSMSDRAELKEKLQSRANILGPDSLAGAYLSTVAANLLIPSMISEDDAVQLRDQASIAVQQADAAWVEAGL